MNADSGSTSSGALSGGARASRGQIAAQACETCRTRKQKCDEQRPKCSLCQRMKLECRYREPQPTKKDKTLVEILDKLKTIESKVDRIPINRFPGGYSSLQPSPTSQPSFTSDNSRSSYSSPLYSASPGTTINRNQPYHHTSAAHSILHWPAMQQLLQSVVTNPADIHTPAQNGSSFIFQVQEGMPILPLDETLQEQPFFGMQSSATRASGSARTTFPALTRDRMHRLANTYFDTFNFLYPFMDRPHFLSETLTKVSTEGFDGDPDSVIALLVFSLGELASDGSTGAPVDGYKGRPSGLRGGTRRRPPGLALFNEARKRIGFIYTLCTLEAVQIFSLAALYYQACSRHAEFWRSSISASLACQVLVTCNQIDWSSPRGDLIKRAFWHCAIMETGLQLELNLQPTEIIELESQIGVPTFQTPFGEVDNHGNQSSHFVKHFFSQVALRRLCADLHHGIFEATSTPETSSGSGPTADSLNPLISKLGQWRAMLPRELQWPEDDPTGSAPSIGESRAFDNILDPVLSSRPSQQAQDLTFTTNLTRDHINHPYVYDIQVALLRTRYYYAKFMVHRPFVYKALHFPNQLTKEDAEGAASCLQACLKWPLTLSPPSRRKRLIPYLFSWSQIFMSILLIIHLTQHDPMLRNIRSQLCGERFEAEIDESMELMIDWIRDLKDSDPIAHWCYQILQPIYNLT